MTSADNAIVTWRRPPWLEWVRRELGKRPGRDITTLRIVVTVTLVAITSMTLQVPNLFLSAFFIMFVTKENRALTMITGVIMMAGVTIAIAISLFLYRFTFDYPEVRVPVMACLIFMGMFLSRVFVIGPLGFVVGFIAALTQTTAESAPNTDALVRGALWLWVAVIYPIALTVVINEVLLPAHPWDALVNSLISRLDAASTALRRMLSSGQAGGQTNPALLEIATRGSSTMSTLLNFSESKDPELKLRHSSLVATIAASEHLVANTAAMEFRQAVAITEKDRECANILLEEIAQLRKTVNEKHPVLPPNQPGEFPCTLPQLRDVQFAVRSFHDGLVKEDRADEAHVAKTAKKPLFVADAFTNPSYLRFALKVTLAAMICYVVYSGLAWPGISTSFVTCIFIALENTGATMRKGWLRLIGCAVGGLLGYLSIIFLIPHMESIVSLVLLTAVGTALGAWVATGSDRISYGGLQGAFAFYICLFQGFEPGINFTLVRDRIAGIVIGIIVSSLVFHYIWPEHAIDGLRSTLARLLRTLAKLLALPKAGVSVALEQADINKMRGDITRDLDNTLKLSELTTFEHPVSSGCPGLTPARLEEMVAHSESLCLMTTILIGRTKLEEWERLSAPAQQAEDALRARVGERLQQVATFVETGRKLVPDNAHASFEAWEEKVASVTGNDRPRLVRRVLEQVRKLS